MFKVLRKGYWGILKKKKRDIDFIDFRELIRAGEVRYKYK